MSAASREPVRLPPLSLVIMALVAGMISFSPWRFYPFALAGQLVLILVLVRAFCYWPPMQNWFAAMPAPHRLVFGFLVGALILGHYTLSNRTTFPFIAWEIFGSPREEDPVTCREMIATTASGKKVRLLVEQLFPSIVQLDPLEKYRPETTGPLIRALAKIYNEHHADDPVRQVDLCVMAVKLHPTPEESRAQPSCELLQPYAISSGR